QFFHHRLPDLLGLSHFEVEGIHVGREDCDVALAEIVDELLRLTQRREAEIGRSRSANRPVHGTDSTVPAPHLSRASNNSRWLATMPTPRPISSIDERS